MKRLLLFLVLLFSIAGISGSDLHAANPKGEKKVSVIYFYGKQRCPTCRAIEQVAKEAVKEINNKNVTLKLLDISDKNNASLVNKYKVSWSSLFVVSGKSKKDLTDEGFRNARSNLKKFKTLLITEINDLLK